MDRRRPPQFGAVQPLAQRQRTEDEAYTELQKGYERALEKEEQRKEAVRLAALARSLLETRRKFKGTHLT